MRLLFTILSLVLTSTAFSMCSWSGIHTYPKTNTIEANSWIIIEGYASSQPIIDSLNQAYPIYLESEGVKIALEIKYLNKGGFRLTQAILAPVEKLIVGKTYILKIDNLTGHAKKYPIKYNPESRKLEPITWTVRGGNDMTSPTFITAPELVDKKTIQYGCGPAVYAVFKIAAKEQSDLLIKTELVDLTSGKTTTYFLNFNENGELQVGHGMCSGAFDYDIDSKYKIRFCLYDMNGNSNNRWSDWISFDSPYQVHRSSR